MHFIFISFDSFETNRNVRKKKHTDTLYTQTQMDTLKLAYTQDRHTWTHYTDTWTYTQKHADKQDRHTETSVRTNTLNVLFKKIFKGFY